MVGRSVLFYLRYVDRHSVAGELAVSASLSLSPGMLTFKSMSMRVRGASEKSVRGLSISVCSKNPQIKLN